MAGQPVPSEIKLHRRSRELELCYANGESYRLSGEYLRVHSPSAEVMGHGPGEEVLQSGKLNVGISDIRPVGHYAVQLVFDDGHDTGYNAPPLTPTGNGAMSDKETTDFGYRKVEKQDKAGLVAGVFDSVAARYDLMNDLMSGGVHRLWKRFTIELSAVRKGHAVLDIAGGTGDLAAQFAEIVGPQGRIVLADINDSMLRVGRDKLLDNGRLGNIEFVQADAQHLPFPNDSFDCISIAFGLRNVTDKDLALRSMLRVLKPGGRLLVLEFSKPRSALLSRLYDAYSFNVLPRIGRIVANDGDSYQYLAESIRMHPDQETLKEMLEDAGFSQCEYYDLSGGIVALHRGVKI